MDQVLLFLEMSFGALTQIRNINLMESNLLEVSATTNSFQIILNTKSYINKLNKYNGILLI